MQNRFVRIRLPWRSYSDSANPHGCSSTKAFCAPVVDGWGNGTATNTDNCSDCLLGTLQPELNSPSGYDAELAKDFTSIASS